MSWFEQKKEGIIIHIRVIPRSSRNGVAGILGNEALKIRIQAPPVEGKANSCLIRYLAGLWKIPRSSFEILSGESSRNKRLQIHNPPDALIDRLRSIDNI